MADFVKVPETDWRNILDATRAALQTVYDSLNQGQQKKIVKDEAVKALFDLYGVEYSE